LPDAIAYTDDQRAFLDGARRSYLIARRRDGTPTGWPMTPLYPGDGNLYFNSYRQAIKVRVVENDPRVCCLVMGADGRTLEVTADVELVTDPERLAPLADRALRDDGFTSPANVAKTRDRLRSGKRCLMLLHPRRLRWLP
jgi:hypothetical protein